MDEPSTGAADGWSGAHCGFGAWCRPFDRGKAEAAVLGAARELLPEDRPANFVAAVDNRYFPLKPGTAFHYKVSKARPRKSTTWS
jgi:hypothetical protein